MRGPLAFAALLWLLGATPPSAEAQDTTTRADALHREREEKAASLTPPKVSRLERALLLLENRRILERILLPPEGFHAKMGSITPGSGLTVGPAYRRPGLFGEQMDFSAHAVGSLKRYWQLETRLTLPRLADGHAFADVYARRSDFPEENFFGLGPDPIAHDAVLFGLRSTEAGASGGIRPAPWLSVGGAVTHLAPRVRGIDDPRSIDRQFDPATVPGFANQPDFTRVRTFVDLNYREPRGNPRDGGQYVASFERFHDRSNGQSSFSRFEVDAQQYISLLRHRRVIALRGLVSTSNADAGAEVPFYLQRTLGGPDDLRGFERFRFRDRHLVLLQAEYRWEIFTAMDGAIFYDAGKVASTRSDLDLRNLESDYGIGFRFGTANGIFLRIEAAYGIGEGPRFVWRYGHVF